MKSDLATENDWHVLGIVADVISAKMGGWGDRLSLQEIFKKENLMKSFEIVVKMCYTNKRRTIKACSITHFDNYTKTRFL